MEIVSEIVHGGGGDAAEEERDEVAGHAEQRGIHLSVEEVDEVEKGRETEREQEIGSEVEKARGGGGVEENQTEEGNPAEDEEIVEELGRGDGPYPTTTTGTQGAERLISSMS